MGLGIKRRLRQRLLQFIRRRGNLLRELAATEELKRTITSSDSALQDLLNSDRARALIEESGFFEERLLSVLRREVQAGTVYETVIKSLADKDIVLKSLHEKPENLLRLFLKLIKDVRFSRLLFESAEFQHASAKNLDFAKAMIKAPEFQQAAMESDTIRKNMLLVPGFQEAALEDESFRGKIAHDETVQQQIIRTAIKTALWQPSFTELLEAILRDTRLYSMVFENPGLTGRFAQEAAKSDTACQRIVQQPALRRASFEHLARGPAWQEEHSEALTRLLHDSRTVDLIVNDGALLGRILSSDPAIVRTATMEPVRWKLQLMRVRERAAELPYLLPAIVVSYPRAGSNFLQSVLQGSSGLRCQSIYGEIKEGADVTLTVKSHSPSPAYFEDEWRRFLPDRPLPAKIIRLQRDPRDVLISFLEYTEANRKTAIRQEEFLNHVDYFYASTVDRDFLRAHYKQGMTVAEAFQEHVRTWYVESPPDCYEILPIRYEDLVLEPHETFKIIFDFLNLDCELAEKFLKVKVSLYSDTGRQRGRIQGWRENFDRYGILIRMIQEQLDDEIRFLGYEEAEASDASDA